VAIWHDGRCVARHERCYGRQQEILDLEHDLDVLEQKPGALAGSKPLAHWRELGRWSTSYDQIWKGLMVRQGRRYEPSRLRAAIEEALALGCTDSAAVRYPVTARDHDRVPPALLEVGALAQFERPLPDVTPYNQLLPGGGTR
jgi:hypothetical protein